MKLFHQIQLIKQSSSPCCGHCFQETGKRKGQALLSELHGQVSKWLGQGAKKVDRNKMPRALHQDSGAGEIIICWGHQESLPGQGDVWGEPCRMGRFPHAALIRGVCVSRKRSSLSKKKAWKQKKSVGYIQGTLVWLKCRTCGGFSGYRAQALGHTDFSSCGSWALEHRFHSCGAWA